MNNILFITGIDTDAGKSYCTAWFAKKLMEEGRRVVTQKFIQTGNIGFSEDIILHRKLTGSGLLEEDMEQITYPVVFSYPASAQLAAKIDGKEIDLNLIDLSTRLLSSKYDIVLLEGAGGLMVPITDEFFTIDYIDTRNLPVGLVTNGRLGSINHTILSLEALKARKITLKYLFYNTFYDADPVISADTRAFIERYVRKHFPLTKIFDVPKL